MELHRGRRACGRVEVVLIHAGEVDPQPPAFTEEVGGRKQVESKLRDLPGTIWHRAASKCDKAQPIEFQPGPRRLSLINLPPLNILTSRSPDKVRGCA